MRSGSWSAGSARELAASRDEAEQARILQRIKNLGATLTDARKEAELYEQHFETWRAAAHPVREELHDLTVPVGALPPLTTAPAEWRPTPEQLAPNRALADFFQIALAVIGGQYEASPELADEPQSGFYVPVPRRVELAVYKGTGAQGGETFKLARLVPAWVIDDKCDLEFVRFAGSDGPFQDRSVDVALSKAGGLSKFKNTQKAVAERIAEALKQSPEQVTSSMEQANNLVDQVQALRSRAADALLADLKRRKELEEAKTALTGVVGNRERQLRIDALKKQIDELEQKRTGRDSA